MEIVLANKKKYTFADSTGAEFKTVVKDWKSLDTLTKDFTEENVNECTIDGTAKKLHFVGISASCEKNGSIVATVRCREFTEIELLAIENKEIIEKNETLKSELEELQIAMAELVENSIPTTEEPSETDDNETPSGVITDGSDNPMPEHKDFGDE